MIPRLPPSRREAIERHRARQSINDIGDGRGRFRFAIGFAAYFEELGRVGLVAENKDKTSVNISGTKMRELLNNGEMPDDRIMRASTAKILVEYYQSKK